MGFFFVFVVFLSVDCDYEEKTEDASFVLYKVHYIRIGRFCFFIVIN